MFNAFLVHEREDEFVGSWEQVSMPSLSANEVLIRVIYSSLNYKDALSASGNKGVTRHYPHVPGIDAAGIVVQSRSNEWPVGSNVIVTGFDLGMNTWGGFGQYIRVPSAWVLRLPSGATLRMAMCMGTAGLTAAISINKLIQAGIVPESGPVAVSGATGGVGSIALAILAKLGYQTTAISGKTDTDFLTKELGATQVVERNEFIRIHEGKAISKTEFSAAIDTVGGTVLSGLLKATQYGGSVTCCGMVNSSELHTSIFPFILRGINLFGVDSVSIPMNLRRDLWDKLLTEWYPVNMDHLVSEITSDELSNNLHQLLSGQAKGRFILKHEAGSSVDQS